MAPCDMRCKVDSLIVMWAALIRAFDAEHRSANVNCKQNKFKKRKKEAYDGAGMGSLAFAEDCDLGGVTGIVVALGRYTFRYVTNKYEYETLEDRWQRKRQRGSRGRAGASAGPSAIITLLPKEPEGE